MPVTGHAVRIAWRVATQLSAAPTGSAAATETSIWPCEYSGWIWSTVTPNAASLIATSRM